MLNAGRRQFKAADPGKKYEENEAVCTLIQSQGEAAFKNAIRVEKNLRVHGPEVYFLRGTPPVGGGNLDPNGAFFQGPDSMNLVAYSAFLFDKKLWGSKAKYQWPMMQHEVAHGVKIDHDDDFNNYAAEECLIRDIEEEEDIERGETGGNSGGGGDDDDDGSDDDCGVIPGNDDDLREECEYVEGPCPDEEECDGGCAPECCPLLVCAPDGYWRCVRIT